MRRNNGVIIVQFALFVALLVGFIYRMPRMHMYEGRMLFFRLLFVLFFWLVTFLLVTSLIKKSEDTDEEKARKILLSRVAKGEISIEEFEEIKQKIKESSK